MKILLELLYRAVSNTLKLFSSITLLIVYVPRMVKDYKKQGSLDLSIYSEEISKDILKWYLIGIVNICIFLWFFF